MTLTPVIPAIQEVRTGRIAVLGQPGKKLIRTQSQPINWVWWYTLVIPATREVLIGGLRSSPAGQKLYSKNN
jgi:hypothetical protein